ncbi:unnamed protein product [Parnassius apollo]|uniref:(apollo) hypothetical protein n=1 Tax=Parnassius apollo TaxID=110799 RepID=A0A8S3XPX3_PARAO|nr:unnamed protein product [Parnassius apollo]
MKTKKCFTEPTPEPPPPDPCKIQKIKEKEKAGIKICKKPPVLEPPPPPPCLAICIEKIKNPPVDPNSKDQEQAVVCTVQQDLPGTARCDEIKAASAAYPDLPWPRCPTPTIPPAPTPDPCEEQRKRRRIAECKERMKSQIIDLESSDIKVNMNRISKEDFEARIANLETLIRRLETEIDELTTNVVESVEETEGQSEEPQQNQRITASTEGESVFSCTPCQINAIIVKDTNFTHKDLQKCAYNLSNSQNDSESDASNSVSDQEEIPACKDKNNSDKNNEYNEDDGNNVKDYEFN